MERALPVGSAGGFATSLLRLCGRCLDLVGSWRIADRGLIATRGRSRLRVPSGSLSARLPSAAFGSPTLQFPQFPSAPPWRLA